MSPGKTRSVLARAQYRCRKAETPAPPPWGCPTLSLPILERAPSCTSQGSPAPTPTQGTLPGVGRKANKEMLVRTSFIGEMPSVGRNHKLSVPWMTGEL